MRQRKRRVKSGESAYKSNRHYMDDAGWQAVLQDQLNHYYVRFEPPARPVATARARAGLPPAPPHPHQLKM